MEIRQDKLGVWICLQGRGSEGSWARVWIEDEMAEQQAVWGLTRGVALSTGIESGCQGSVALGRAISQRPPLNHFII